jgi:hypothetical protein
MSVYTESRSKLHEPCKGPIGWDTVIEDAKSEIARCQQRIARLKRSIKLAKQMIREGTPFDEPYQNGRAR